MSLLAVVQGVARRCNLTAPASAIGATDPNVLAILDAIQDTGDELVERWGWQNLKIQAPVTFTGDGTTAAWPLPMHFQRLGPSDTFVSSLYPWLRMPGPINEENLLIFKKIPINVLPSVWRIVGNQIEFYPALASGEVVSYVYANNSWVLDLNGNAYSTPVLTADTDTFAIAERLLRLGGVWRYKYAKGLEYAEQMQDFELALTRIAGQETTTRSVNMSRAPVLSDETLPGTISDLTVLNQGNL